MALAIVAGCQKCSIVVLCSLKGIIGDNQKPKNVLPLPPAVHPAPGKK